MSPHALSESDSEYDTHRNASRQASSSASRDEAPTLVHDQTSLLERYDDDEVHDLVCIGFGPASLAIAVALHDTLESDAATIKPRRPKVRFLERQERFAWHAGMLLPGSKMQITFVKDLATLRNPRSNFTFLNYLHKNNRLTAFANLGTFLPQRIEYEDYMRWCANHFQDVVDYSQDVRNVEVGTRNASTGAVQSFEVIAQDRRTGALSRLRTKNVVIAAGGRPSIPKCLSATHPRVIHSSQYATEASKIFPPGTAPRRVAVIGGGQSAAEVFHSIPTRFPGAQSTLIVRGAALRPSDDSPFVNEVFNPERVDDIYSQDPQLRAEAIALDRATNYGVVRLELLEEIYAEMYSYRIQYRSERDWPHRILTHRDVVGLIPCKINGQPGVNLQIQDRSGIYSGGKGSQMESFSVDLVVVASGYTRNAHEEMLQNLTDLMPARDVPNNKWSVRRDYGLNFEEGAVQRDAGVWLQGCNESTHGLADSLLSILAVRGGEMVQSIFGSSDDKHGLLNETTTGTSGIKLT